MYNNFPWPDDASEAQREAIADAARMVLLVRGTMPEGNSLADLYDPNVMPPTLREAHRKLDLAVDRAYRSTPFRSELERVEYLFSLYRRLVAPLGLETRKRKGRS